MGKGAYLAHRGPGIDSQNPISFPDPHQERDPSTETGIIPKAAGYNPPPQKKKKSRQKTSVRYRSPVLYSQLEGITMV